jgi:hypothetical protein
VFKDELQNSLFFSCFVNMFSHSVCLDPIFYASRRHELQLTSVTYIEVASISLAGLKQESVISLSSSKCLKHGSLSTILPCLLFHRKLFTVNKCMQFHSRVGCFVLIFDPLHMYDL